MTIHEFSVYQLAFQIKSQHEMYNIALQSWFNQTVQATTGSGKNVKSKYSKFDQFYDNEKNFKQIFKHESKQKELSIADRNKILNERRKQNAK